MIRLLSVMISIPSSIAVMQLGLNARFTSTAQLQQPPVLHGAKISSPRPRISSALKMVIRSGSSKVSPFILIFMLGLSSKLSSSALAEYGQPATHAPQPVHFLAQAIAVSQKLQLLHLCSSFLAIAKWNFIIAELSFFRFPEFSQGFFYYIGFLLSVYLPDACLSGSILISSHHCHRCAPVCFTRQQIAKSR